MLIQTLIFEFRPLFSEFRILLFEIQRIKRIILEFQRFIIFLFHVYSGTYTCTSVPFHVATRLKKMAMMAVRFSIFWVR